MVVPPAWWCPVVPAVWWYVVVPSRDACLCLLLPSRITRCPGGIPTGACCHWWLISIKFQRCVWYRNSSDQFEDETEGLVLHLEELILYPILYLWLLCDHLWILIWDILHRKSNSKPQWSYPETDYMNYVLLYQWFISVGDVEKSVKPSKFCVRDAVDR